MSFSSGAITHLGALPFIRGSISWTDAGFRGALSRARWRFGEPQNNEQSQTSAVTAIHSTNEGMIEGERRPVEFAGVDLFDVIEILHDADHEAVKASQALQNSARKARDGD
ncbi:MAG: hypothetical protein R3C42_07130 [Parvularculaceae bacterium]